MKNTCRKSRAGRRCWLTSDCEHLRLSLISALLVDASARYSRLATIQGKRDDYIPFAVRARDAVLAKIDPASGTLTQVCDICDERMMREQSAEGQAFVVLMEAAHRDWKALQSE